MAVLTRVQKQTLKKQIGQDARSAPKGLKDAFCKAWPDTKKSLQDLSALLKNPIAKAVTAVVIDIGQTASDVIC